MSHLVFIYSCPGYKSSVKERMLYSSCKAAAIEIAETNLQMEIVKKVMQFAIYWMLSTVCLCRQK